MAFTASFKPTQRGELAVSEEPKEGSVLERHIQSILTALVLAAIVYVASQLTGQQTQQAVVLEKLATLEARITDLKTDLNDRVSKADAKNIELQIMQLQQRVDRLEKSSVR